MKRKQLKTLLDAGNISSFYVFLGDDWYMKKVYIERIASMLGCSPEFINVHEESELDNLLRTASQPPMFSPSNRLMVGRIGYNRPLIKQIIPASKTTVIIDTAEMNGEIGKEHVVEFDPPSISELEGFISYRLRNAKPQRHITPTLRRQIAMKFSHSTYALNLFIDTLLAYLGEKSNITKDDIIACGFPEHIHSESLPLLSMTSEKELTRLIERLKNNKEPYAVIQELSTPYINAYISALAGEKKSFSPVNKVDTKRIEDIILLLSSLDEEIKSGGGNSFWELFKAGLYQLVVKKTT